jgi:hypothetical protein
MLNLTEASKRELFATSDSYSSYASRGLACMRLGFRV